MISDEEPLIEGAWHWWEMYSMDPNDDMIDRDGEAVEYGSVSESKDEDKPEIPTRVLDLSETIPDACARKF